MADTYTLIEKITVGAGGASSVTFSSIPQTYTDLKIVTSARTTSAIAEDFLYARFNADSGSNYTLRLLRGNGSTVASGTITSGTYAYVGQIEGTSNTASTFTNSECYIPNYTSSNQKSYSTDTVAENNATSAYEAIIAGIWTGTAAISSIVLTPAQGNFTQYSTFYLYGIAKEGVTPSLPSAPYATGGDSILFDGTYWIHTFLSSGTFTPKKSLTCDYLVVAGGASGGWGTGSGGGGAGGLRSTVTATGGGGSLESALSLTANTGYTVTIGAGGAGLSQQPGNVTGNSGSNSTFSSITSTGGGGGGGEDTTVKNGVTGGSGGGGSYLTGNTAGSGTANQGYAGSVGSFSGSNYGGGGGGGAGAAGAGRNGSTGGAGGAGVATSISGSSVTYAGGGGGSGQTSSGTQAYGGAGGTGGGGTGAGYFSNSTGIAAIAGTANTGGGGGGGGAFTGGGSGAGGSGIVIVRYAA